MWIAKAAQPSEDSRLDVEGVVYYNVVRDVVKDPNWREGRSNREWHDRIYLDVYGTAKEKRTTPSP